MFREFYFIKGEGVWGRCYPRALTSRMSEQNTIRKGYSGDPVGTRHLTMSERTSCKGHSR